MLFSNNYFYKKVSKLFTRAFLRLIFYLIKLVLLNPLFGNTQICFILLSEVL